MKNKIKRYSIDVKTILNVVKSDSTFSLHTLKDGEQLWVGKCLHCKSLMTIPCSGKTHFLVELIIPRYAGGGNTVNNMAMSCGCNKGKRKCVKR